MRQIVLDTETTGLEPSDGHRIIEIGCVEMINRRLTGETFHVYLQPDREIDDGAVEVHGITNEMLADKPRFTDIADDFVSFVRGAELVIHNAPFDVGFLDHELGRLAQYHDCIGDICSVLDTLKLARQMFPGQRNSLDALCKRFDIDNSQRELHGALLDAEILSDVYLAMTGGQVTLELDVQSTRVGADASAPSALRRDRPALKIVKASPEELMSHQERLTFVDKESGGKCLWLRQESVDSKL